MIRVGMREDDVFDTLAIEAEFSHAAEDFVLRRVVEQRFENDGSLAADNCPRAVNLRAQEIKIVGNPGWFCIPGLFGRRSGKGSTRSSAGGDRRRRNTEAKKGARPINTSCILGRPEQAIDRRGRRLSHHCWRRQDNGKRDERYPYEFHRTLQFEE